MTSAVAAARSHRDCFVLSGQGVESELDLVSAPVMVFYFTTTLPGQTMFVENGSAIHLLVLWSEPDDDIGFKEQKTVTIPTF